MGAEVTSGRKMQPTKPRRRGLFAFTLATVLAASCATVVATVSSSAASGKPPFPSAALKAALKYDGGTPGAADPKKSPISIGWVSDQTALTGHPGNQSAVDAAVAFINDDLDGIDGHPLKLVTCDITTSDAQGTSCAQQMINNHAVKVVTEGELLTGEANFTDSMAGAKPVIGVFTDGPGLTAKNAFYVDGGIYSQLSLVTYLAKIVGVKSVAMIGPDLPAVAGVLAMFKELFGALGVSSTVVEFPPASTDLISAIAASGAASDGATFLALSTTGECIAVDKALNQLGIHKPTVALSFCLQPGVKKGLGDYPKWTYVFTNLNYLAHYAPDSDTAAYVAAMDRYGNPNLLNSGYAPLTFGMILTVAHWLNQLVAQNKYTASAIIHKAATFTGPMWMGDPHIKFGVPPFATIGSTRGLFYTYLGNNKYKADNDGHFVSAPIP